MSEDNVHGYCLDCGKKMSDKWMYNNAFAQEGAPPSCNTCGGVVAVVEDKNAFNEIAKNQRARGINRQTRPTIRDWDKAGEKFDIPPVPNVDQ